MAKNNQNHSILPIGSSHLYYDNYAFGSSHLNIAHPPPPTTHQPQQSSDQDNNGHKFGTVKMEWVPPELRGYSGYNMTGDELQSSAAQLSWRKLHLSRAKLKAINKTSALMSGFAMVAMVEMQLSEDTKVPSGLLVAFVICTSLLVAVHMLALMISTCILPNVEAISNLHNINIVEESPHERMHWYIEAGWAFSTVLGIFLFLCELAILCWVKFYDYSIMAASSATVIMVPVLILFIGFAIHFYHKLVVHKYELTESGLRELEQLRNQLDSTTGQSSPNPTSPRNNISIV